MRLYAAEPVLSRWKLSTRWSKTAHLAMDLPSPHLINPRLIRFVLGKASECRWRPRRYQVEPWSRRLDVARGVLRSSPKPEKKYCIFCHRRGIDNFLSPVFYTSVNKCCCIRRLADARHVSQAMLWTLWPEGGSEPPTSAPRSEIVTLSLVFSIDVCQGPRIWPLRIEHLAEFVSGRSWPNICAGIIFSGFSQSLERLFWRFVLIANGAEIVWRISLKFRAFLATSRCHRSYRQHPKSIVQTIPIYGQSSQSMVRTIPVHRQCPRSICPGNST